MSDLAPAVAAWGLPTAHRLPVRVLDVDEFELLLAECTQDRVLGLLGAAVRAGALVLHPPQRAALDEVWREWLAHALRMARLVAAVVGALDAAGIPALVVKGPALAETVYDDPAARVFGDVDVVVASHCLHEAASTLEQALGGRRAEPELRAGFDDRFAREVLVAVGDVEVDLHRTFVNGAYGRWVGYDGCFAAADRVAIGGRAVGVLAPVDRTVMAAYGAVLSDWPPRLIADRDLVQTILHDDPPVDAVVARAAEWRGEAVLAAAVRQAWRRLRVVRSTPLLLWAEEHRARPVDRLLLRAYRGGARGYTSQLTSLLAMSGIGERIAFVRAVAWPSREYRDARRLGRLALVGAGVRRAKRT